MFYSKSTGGFYSREVHGDNIPADAVEITPEKHAELLEGQTAGMVIAAGPDGVPVLQEQPAPTPEQTIEAMRTAIQAHMDTAAQSYGYDDVKAAVTYAEEPAVPKFQAEGRAFRAWRSIVWDHAYGVLADVQAGEREQPTIEELIAELPELIIEV